MCELGSYMRSSAPEWMEVQARAERENTWFIPRFTTAAIQAIGTLAENHQVLFFTCHPDHAGELQSLAAAKHFQMTT